MNVPGPGVFFEGAALGVTFFSSSMEIGWMGSTYLYEDQLQFSKKKKKNDYFTKIFKCICWQLCKVVILFSYFGYLLFCVFVFSLFFLVVLKLCWSFPHRFSSSSAVFVFNNIGFFSPFSFFFFLAWPHQAACGISGIEPRTLRQWKCSVPATGPPGSSLLSNHSVSFINLFVLYIAVSLIPSHFSLLCK